MFPYWEQEKGYLEYENANAELKDLMPEDVEAAISSMSGGPAFAHSR
jgi:hypothetical protein